VLFGIDGRGLPLEKLEQCFSSYIIMSWKKWLEASVGFSL